MADIEKQLRSKLNTQLTRCTARLAKVRATEKTLTAEITTIKGKLSKFNEVFGANGAPRRKPGPKTTAAKASATTKTRGKPGPKVSKPKAVKAKTNNTRAAQGRREVARNERPAIHKAMITVMGSKVMNASDVFEALKAKNWLPNSNDPRTYISYVFSTYKNTAFERVESKGRGYYRVRAGVTVDAIPTTAAPIDNGKSTKATASDVDEVLKDAGVIPDASTTAAPVN